MQERPQDPIADPFRRDGEAATDEALTALVEQGPVSNELGRALVFEESQLTDRVFGFLQSDNRRAFDAQQARVFGEQYRNELTPEEANRRYGVEGYLSFDQPVNVHRAEEMNRQAQLRRYRQETAARADLSALDTIGASIAGTATDPVLLPTWFIGGGGAAMRALRVAPATTRLGAVGRGAVVGLIDGTTGGVAAESINAAARISTGEDYDGGDALRNILFGTALGGVVGGTTGGIAGPPRPRGAVADLIAEEAGAMGEDAGVALRIAQIESGLNPRAQNRRSSAGGLFQFIDDTWARFGGGDKYDARRNARAGVRLLAENRVGLRAALGREPGGWELYLAHQQGLGGATELLRDPARPAVDALRAAGVRNPGRALTLNGGHAGMTAGEFAGLWRRKFGEGGPPIEALTPQPMPPVLRGLTDNERVGGFTEALEAMAEDGPVDLGALAARNGLETLDEASAVPSIRGQWLEPDVAVTRTGGEIPVRFAVVELDDLVTSHDDDLVEVADYPQALQPRDRGGRAGSIAENFLLEEQMNPKLLMRDKAASGGAPIVSPDGLVESGNGRVIALRRSARTGTGAWKRYLPELTAQNIDTTGFRRPVLVRVRAEAMTGAKRAEMTALLNQSQTERYSPVEQAVADARKLDADALGLIQGDNPFAASNRPFLRAFVERAGAGEKNALTDADGAINDAGRERIRAALVQAAYKDRELTAALFESGDEALLAVGQALADAAPAWARMTAEAPKHLDLTGNLTAAVHMLRHARQSREATDQVLARMLASRSLFDGAAVAPETEAMLRLMFKDADLTSPRGSERLGWALRAYANDAAATPPGEDLFGETPNGRAFIEDLQKRLDGAEGPGRSGLAFAGGDEPQWTTREAGAAVLDLRRAEPNGGGPDGEGQRPRGGGGAEGDGGWLKAEARAADIIASDPELKALMADTEALAVASGVDLPGFEPSTEPSTVAEAIRAAAFCLATETVA